MRSVVVVLPASMWAMMPMFLQRSNGTCLGTIFSVSAVRPCGRVVSVPPLKGSHFNSVATQRSHAGLINFALRAEDALPAVVRESLVGLGHAVYVFLLLDGCATAIRRVEQLVRQLVDHALFATAAAVGQDPANCQRGATVGIDFDRNL